MSDPTRSRPRHLLDPESLGRPSPNLTVERARLERVQRWVMSSLAVTTILHLSAGLSIAAWFMDADRAVPRYGLVVIAGILGVLSVAAALALHKKSPWSPWLLLGALPTVVGVIALTR